MGLVWGSPYMTSMVRRRGDICARAGGDCKRALDGVEGLGEWALVGLLGTVVPALVQV